MEHLTLRLTSDFQITDELINKLYENDLDYGTLSMIDGKVYYNFDRYPDRLKETVKKFQDLGIVATIEE